ncbi:hypothetical protein ASPCAL04257 [Aspergillus calidoustus]|uniref:Uncharacterized protein n=1 Tax=Aspergillus calidoustus TaxID=454130 RepID=A0A0U5FUJ4_ASPCI|nr:hypothetical protein ASPCAL04257 [Aspergillus calidoustus]
MDKAKVASRKQDDEKKGRRGRTGTSAKVGQNAIQSGAATAPSSSPAAPELLLIHCNLTQIESPYRSEYVYRGRSCARHSAWLGALVPSSPLIYTRFPNGEN